VTGSESTVLDCLTSLRQSAGHRDADLGKKRQAHVPEDVTKAYFTAPLPLQHFKWQLEGEGDHDEQ
jgi:hypothetical protein